MSNIGQVTDYFGLASAKLIAESSEGGEDKPHVCAYNATSEAPATDDGGTWVNPRVTYRVVGSGTITIKIGKGYVGDNRTNTSGYMITSAELRTAIGEAPLLTVNAVANEGIIRAADAVKTYSVSWNVSARHRPQDVMSAITTSGYHLQDATITAVCDPVVLAENGMPCASDVCHGRIEMSATLADYGSGDSIAAANGFTITGSPVSKSGSGYTNIVIRARKEIV